MQDLSNPQKPWYRHFWPWFMIGLLGSAVAASFATLYIALDHRDSLVVDDYYQEGLAINHSIDQDKAARRLGIRAKLRFDLGSGEVVAAVAPAAGLPGSLELMLIHPFDSSKDFKLPLQRVASGQYRGDLPMRLAHRYYLRLLTAGNSVWRLNGEIDFATDTQVRLAPGD